MWFYFLVPFLYFLAILPNSLLYALSSVISWFLEYIFGYRKQVIDKNLATAFPSKTLKERNEIKHLFYIHLADIIIENIIFLSISKKELAKRFTVSQNTYTLLNEMYAQNKNIFLVMSHSGNWEWTPSLMKLLFDYEMAAVYKTIHQKYVNQFIKTSRQRFGAQLITKREVVRKILGQRNHLPTAYGFLADQYPGKSTESKEVVFFNKSIPFINGYSLLAEKLKIPLIYVQIKKGQRGHYLIDTHILSSDGSNPTNTVQAFATSLEQQIKEQPENWLWSHKRWKKIGLY